MSKEYYDWSKPSFVETRTFTLLFWGGILIAIFSLLYFISNNEPAFVNPKIEADKFVWPEGCEQKKYKKFDQISADCLTHYIGNGRDYGWSRHKSGPNKYFRIENDALNAVCGMIDGKCTVIQIVNEVYVVGAKND